MKIEIPDELDSLDDVPEKFKDLYVPKPGGAGGFVFDNLKGLKENNRALKTEKSTLAQQLKEKDAAEKAAIEARDAALEAVETLKAERGETPAELAKIKKDLEDSFAAKEKSLATQRDTFKGRLARRTMDVAIKTALDAASVTESGRDILPSLLAGEITVEFDDDGEPEIKILDKKGRPRLVAETAEEMDLPALIADFRKKHPVLFKGNGNSGGGGGGGEDDDLDVQNKKPSTWNEKQRKTYIKNNGHPAYLKLVTAEAEAKSAERKRA